MLRSQGKYFLKILLYFFYALQFSESTAQVEIYLETFKPYGSGFFGQSFMGSYNKQVLRFEVCFGITSLNCFLSNALVPDKKTKMIHFPKTLSKDLNNPIILKSQSSKVHASLRLRIYNQSEFFFQLEWSTRFSFDSVGMKKFTLTSDKELMFPKDKSVLSLTISMNCDNNFKPPDCVDKICVDHDDDINGHYTCNINGTITCRDGWSDPSTKCRTVSMRQQILRVGCYKDLGVIDGKRLFTKFVNYRSLIDWNNMRDSFKNITELCSSYAKDNNFQYFGIEFWGECWTGSTLDINYNRDGVSTDCWPSQSANIGPMLVGKDATIMVYKWNKLTS